MPFERFLLFISKKKQRNFDFLFSAAGNADKYDAQNNLQLLYNNKGSNERSYLLSKFTNNE